MLYDADCGLCKWLLSGLLRWDRSSRLRPIALQRPEAAELLNDLAPAEQMESWHLISPSGQRFSGGEAVPKLVRLLPAGALPAAVFALSPHATDRGYRWIANHRSVLSRFVRSSSKARASRFVQRAESEHGQASRS